LASALGVVEELVLLHGILLLELPVVEVVDLALEKLL
jgi:hypothetical protein